MRSVSSPAVRFVPEPQRAIDGSEIAAVLDEVRIGGQVFCTIDAGVPWSMRGGPDPFATFHAVTEGGGWLRVQGEEPMELRAGQVAVMPGGGAHAVSDIPDWWDG